MVAANVPRGPWNQLLEHKPYTTDAVDQQVLYRCRKNYKHQRFLFEQEYVHLTWRKNWLCYELTNTFSRFVIVVCGQLIIPHIEIDKDSYLPQFTDYHD